MGKDDDKDCIEHVWVLGELDFTSRGATAVSSCSRCGAVNYEPAAGNDPARPPL